MELAPSDFWLFASLEEYLKEIYFTNDDEVQATIGKWFQESLNNSEAMGSKNLLTTGSVVSNTGRLCGKIRYRSTVQILSYILLCSILIPCL
jgi:hypothetical protein